MGRLSALRDTMRAEARRLHGDPRAVVARAQELVAAGDSQAAFELCRAAPRGVRAMRLAEIRRWLPALCDWNSTDCFGCFVSGVAWREGVLPEAEVLRWARSQDRWTRRAALVSTVPLNLPARGATAPGGERRKTLRVCERLVDDRDDMVVKALSWALRVLARKDPAGVRTFVKTHRSRLAPRVLREVGHMLTTGLKSPRRGATPGR